LLTQLREEHPLSKLVNIVADSWLQARIIILIIVADAGEERTSLE